MNSQNTDAFSKFKLSRCEPPSRPKRAISLLAVFPSDVKENREKICKEENVPPRLILAHSSMVSEGLLHAYVTNNQ